MRKIRAALCTGFWCTNIGNAFTALGAEYVLRSVLGDRNVSLVSDLQTYPNGIGKRQYPHKNQLEYLSTLDVDYLVLVGPVLSRFFLPVWKEILIRLHHRGVRYLLLSAGIYKLEEDAAAEITAFFKQYPPFAFASREEAAFSRFGAYAEHAYNGICLTFFAPEYYAPVSMPGLTPFILCNFDKGSEPAIWRSDPQEKRRFHLQFSYGGERYCLRFRGPRSLFKTDRFTDALIYLLSVFPAPRRENALGVYRILRTDHRFFPHYRQKIYRSANSFCADVPYGYLNLYANGDLTLSDRIHACTIALSFGHSAMLFARTGRSGLLARVGAEGITEHPVKLDMAQLAEEKAQLLNWLRETLTESSARTPSLRS